MGSYLEFLKYLVALGPKFPQLLIILQEIVDKVREAISIVTDKPMEFAGAEAANMQPTAEEIDQERKLASVQLRSGEMHGAAGDLPSVLRTLWTFLQSNPELLTLVISLFTKKK